jgi:Xaa-Pro aminopeptidase
VTAVSDTTVTVTDHGGRVERVRQWLAEREVEAYLVTDLLDIRWLTGFGGSNGWVVVRPDDLILGTDGRYAERARAETADAEDRRTSGAGVIAEQVRSRLHERMLESLAGAGTVGADASTMTHGEWTTLCGDVALVATPSPIRALRGVKDGAEIERISAAARAADLALAEVEPLLFDTDAHPVTEADVRTELEYRMRCHGADDRSYETIVASGPDHAARPHHEVSRRTILAGDTVIIDVGALVDGYHSDMTRSYVIGDPTPEQRDVYELVVQAHAAGIEALRPGVPAREVDAACRSVFAAAGYGDWFLHGTGHGVGLQIHEAPFHSASSDEVIEAGNVVTIEPGLYRGGFGGFRIEDLLVVTEDGSRPLTHTPPRPFPG